MKRPMPFGNVPPDMLAGAVEKTLARMDESELALCYERELPSMSSDAVHAFVHALLDAFHERGESSDDAAEGAGTTLEAIVTREPSAVGALLGYARSSPDLIKEATALVVERRPDLVEMLPSTLRAALADRLSLGTGA